MLMFGEAVVKVDGQVLKSVGGTAKLNPGGLAGTTRMGGGKVHGASYLTKESTLTVDLVIDDGDDPLELQKIRDAVIEFVDAQSGAGYVINRAWFLEMGEFEEGEGAKVSVTFGGEPATRI